jgi:hypothetical protein
MQQRVLWFAAAGLCVQVPACSVETRDAARHEVSRLGNPDTIAVLWICLASAM